MAEMDKTIKELKREAKLQKALKKREKKQAKRGKKAQRKDTKKESKAKKYAMKAGMDYVTPTSPDASEAAGEDNVIEWDRRSSVPMDKVEKQLDNLFESRGDEIRKRWEEKYGDEPDIPAELFRPKVDMVDLDRAPTSPTATGTTEPEPEKRRFGKGKKDTSRADTDDESKPLGLFDLKKPTEGLWLYQKYGLGDNKIVSIIMMLVSFILWIPMIIPRFVVLIIRSITGAIKKKKTPTEG